MRIKMSNIRGEFDLIILQLKNHFSCKYKRLKKYRNAVWDTMEFFNALNITTINRDQNRVADKIVVEASTLQPWKELINGDGKLEIKFRPSFPDNVKHWWVLHDNEEIKRFVELTSEFSTSQIDQDEDIEVIHAEFCF